MKLAFSTICINPTKPTRQEGFLYQTKPIYNFHDDLYARIIAFENEDDLKSFAEILKIKAIKVPDNEGKLVEFSDKAKAHLIDRISEHSRYWISKNTK